MGREYDASRAVSKYYQLIITVAVSEFAGVIGSVFTVGAIPTWYASLAKPAATPPGWVFGPVWTALYFLMGVAAWLVWKQWGTSSSSARLRIHTALTVFGLQLLLNVFWSVVFFGLRLPGAALFEIIFLWLTIVATILAFYKISRLAAWLLVPYLVWVSYAGYLNFSIWVLNR